METKIEKMISVIVPIYNVEQYLRRCIDSILNQTYSELEIILVDDGSLDNCPAICDEYAQKDSRIKVIHKKNGGLSDARNAGLNVMTGEYVTFVDSDDWIESTAVEEYYSALQENKVDIVQGGVMKDWNNTSVVYREVETSVVFNRHDAIEDISNYIILNKKESVLMNGVWGTLYRSSLFINTRFVVGRIWEDTQIKGILFDKAENGVAVIQGIQYHWYQGREASISHQVNIKSRVDSFLAHKDNYDLFYENPDYSDFKEKFVLRCLKSVVICWSELYGFPIEERQKYWNVISEMACFMKKYYELARKNYDKSIVFLIVKFKADISINIVHLLNNFRDHKQKFKNSIYRCLRFVGQPIKKLVRK